MGRSLWRSVLLSMAFLKPGMTSSEPIFGNFPLLSALELAGLFTLLLSNIMISYNQLQLTWILINKLIVFQANKLHSIQQWQQAEIQKC